MSQDTERRPRAAGHIYAYDPRSDTQVLLFGRCAADPNRVNYQVSEHRRGRSPEHYRLQVTTDVQKVKRSGVLADVGVNPVDVTLTVDGTSTVIHFEPDASAKENATFRTDTGLHGAIIETQSTEWALVALVAVLAATLIAGAGIATDTGVSVDVKVDTPVGDVDVDVEVGRGGDGEGEGGGGGEGGGQ